ncbi:isopentenyl-diphosphate Delta-isomerase [Glutamicibacter mishrai]|uniref:Isopentenyl-diphosphate Delta-isomerase n=1 Tax=Glutamicibacter mishrai TaxID=1775880 RepID=A0A6H0SLF6_9MICC|nr:isopentenyl-diphosphate Delta-isomerase [Glutamicibacter mishrai]QIV88293.1 isopentenyl-diphosphate Delta-isomerase [Glutamicibacter mishrai]
MDVILLSADGQPIGTQSKQTVHTRDTPLHQAFSCHVRNSMGQVLMTRRALSKATWPGVWTNSFCGHPQPGEQMETAIRRHAAGELGMEIRDIQVALPDFRYRAVDASGIVENEICPVFTAVIDGGITMNPEEVMDYRWADPAEFAVAVQAVPWVFSPWLVMQASEMPQYQTR